MSHYMQRLVARLDHQRPPRISPVTPPRFSPGDDLIDDPFEVSVEDADYEWPSAAAPDAPPAVAPASPPHANDIPQNAQVPGTPLRAILPAPDAPLARSTDSERPPDVQPPVIHHHETVREVWTEPDARREQTPTDQPPPSESSSAAPDAPLPVTVVRRDIVHTTRHVGDEDGGQRPEPVPLDSAQPADSVRPVSEPIVPSVAENVRARTPEPFPASPTQIREAQIVQAPTPEPLAFPAPPPIGPEVVIGRLTVQVVPEPPRPAPRPPTRRRRAKSRARSSGSGRESTSPLAARSKLRYGMRQL